MNIQWSITVVVSRLKGDVPSVGISSIEAANQGSGALILSRSHSVLQQHPSKLHMASTGHRFTLGSSKAQGGGFALLSLAIFQKRERYIFWPRRRNQNRKLHKFWKELENTDQNWSSFPSFSSFRKSPHMRWKTWMSFPVAAVSFVFTVFSCLLVRTRKGGDIIPRHVICRFGWANTHWPVF